MGATVAITSVAMAVADITDKVEYLKIVFYPIVSEGTPSEEHPPCCHPGKLSHQEHTLRLPVQDTLQSLAGRKTALLLVIQTHTAYVAKEP